MLAGPGHSHSVWGGFGMGRWRREELFISTKVYFKSLFPLRTIPTGRLNQCHYPECLWAKGERGVGTTLYWAPTAIHRCTSFTVRPTIPWLYICRRQAQRGQVMGSGRVPRPTRHQDPWTHKLPVSPHAYYVNTRSWVGGHFTVYMLFSIYTASYNITTL